MPERLPPPKEPYELEELEDEREGVQLLLRDDELLREPPKVPLEPVLRLA